MKILLTVLNKTGNFESEVRVLNIEKFPFHSAKLLSRQMPPITGLAHLLFETS